MRGSVNDLYNRSLTEPQLELAILNKAKKGVHYAY